MFKRIYAFIRNKYIGFIKSSASKRIRRKGYGILETVSSLFDENALVGYIYYGTLLGFVREGDFIKGDYDIDFACLANGDQDILLVRNKMLEKGFKLCSSCYYDGKIVEESFLIKRIRVDISYFRYCPNDNAWETFVLYSSENNGTPCFKALWEVNHDMPLKIDKKVFKNKKINLPANSNIFIARLFGDGWKKPDKDWKWDAAPNVSHAERAGEKRYY